MQIIEEIVSFFAPAHCYGCGDCIETRGLFCEDCLSICQLLSKEGRCRRCFSRLIPNLPCHECSKYPIIHRRGALFEKEEILRGLLRYRIKQQKTVAALFTWQFCRLHWPIFDTIATEPLLGKVGRLIAKDWKKPFHRMGRIDEGARVLFLSIGDTRVDFPFSVMMGQVYHLSFFF